jgi:hypothetical protein
MAECNNCGAPDDGEHVVCKFCKQPITKDLLDSAIACPTCRAPNRAGRSTCSSCNGSLLYTCVFCGHQTVASKSDCEKCGEAFAGAAERKQQRESEKLISGVAGFVGNVLGIGGGSSSQSSSSSNDYSSSSSGSSGGGGGYGGNDGGAPPMDT